ncbi:hypothetical protein [Paenibacillus agri]|uniref:Poly A polymerase head domain-containing protein n=1 Tax=Paenibacillus agri TaxID=2744309 RepID=A0A850EHR6_9BACL|nr:hypothetical protein [Paenibacillus agri]NUU58954.1 hypothetical protein [Paenibacillus agri]
MGNAISHTSFREIAEYIDVIRNEDSVNTLFQRLESRGNVVIVGGTIRDILFNKKKPRDIDIILDTEDDVLDDVFVGMKYSRNRFGGYKAIHNKQIFDIWTIRSNWAFKNNIVDTKVENIPKGCFYNLDAAYFNLATGEGEATYFKSALNNKRLDIILDEQYIDCNPSPEINIIRAMVLKKQYELSYSSRVKKYISNWLCTIENPVIELKSAELKHYKTNDKIDEKEIDELMLELAVE